MYCLCFFNVFFMFFLFFFTDFLNYETIGNVFEMCGNMDYWLVGILTHLHNVNGKHVTYK